MCPESKENAWNRFTKWKDDNYDLAKGKVPRTFSDLDNEILDSGNWRMKYEGAGNASGKGTWDMLKGGGYINGRRYSQHAMERMAPDTPQVRAELEKIAGDLAKERGFEPQTKAYWNFVKKYVDPRNIPPRVIEDAIKNNTSVLGKYADTFIHETADVKVVVNGAGDVITVIPK